MAETLKRKGAEVQLIAWIPSERISETDSWDVDVKSLGNVWYSKLPIIRSYLVQLHVLFILLFDNSNVIFHELSFFRVLVFLKKLFPKRKYVHYATELYDENDVPAHRRLLEFYKVNASKPDIIIECDQLRANYRKKFYDVKSPILVVPNTIPKFFENKNPPDLYSISGLNSKPASKVVLYAGAGYLHREIDRIIDGIALCETKVFFLAFCYGPESEIKIIREYANKKLGTDRVKICSAVERNILISCIDQADIGVVYYRPSLSIGNKFASPTKLFEYLSRGLPVLCSNNESLLDIINDNGFGVCVNDESVKAIADAVDNISHKLDCDENWSRDILYNFNKKFEYETYTDNAFNELLRML
ncbi:glycosyltransferase [Aeromonas caviae]|nr:glycosyltransferase [Aeromonas caviae]